MGRWTRCGEVLTAVHASCLQGCEGQTIPSVHSLCLSGFEGTRQLHGLVIRGAQEREELGGLELWEETGGECKWWWGWEQDLAFLPASSVPPSPR